MDDKKKQVKKFMKDLSFSENPSKAIFDSVEEGHQKLDGLSSVLEKKKRGLDAMEGIFEFLRGDDGKTPEAGKDYFTEEERNQFLEKATPVRGKDYFTSDDIAAFLEHVTPQKGTDYFTEGEISQIVTRATPRKGVDYRDGRDGTDGVSPQLNVEDVISEVLRRIRPPKDGTSVYVEDVIKALRELKGNDRLDISAIKNSEQLLYGKGNRKKIDTSDLRWHGGGLSPGSFHLETPSGLVDSSNVTYTVTSEIRAVVSFFINGEYIHPGEYSFSGTTITFVTALDSSLSGKPFTILYV